MKNLLAFVGGAVVTFAALGWYLDWYKIQSQTGPAGHRKLNIDFDSAKFTDDVQKGVQKGEQKLQGTLDKNGVGRSSDASKATDPTLFLPPNPTASGSTDPGLYIPGTPSPNQ
jgi:hypothetical protein